MFTSTAQFFALNLVAQILQMFSLHAQVLIAIPESRSFKLLMVDELSSEVSIDLFVSVLYSVDECIASCNTLRFPGIP